MQNVTTVQSEALTETLARNVRRERLRAGIGGDAAARATNMTTWAFHQCEAGTRRFTPTQLADLCQLLDRPPSTFFED